MLTLSAPFGDVVLDTAERPLVLVSAGIGCTPMVAMLEHLAATGSGRPVTVLHADRSPAEHALRADMARLVAELTDARAALWYEEGAEAVPQARTGRMDLADLDGLDVPSDADVYLCGPLPFMRTVRAQLLAAGVPPARCGTRCSARTCGWRTPPDGTPTVPGGRNLTACNLTARHRPRLHCPRRPRPRGSTRPRGRPVTRAGAGRAVRRCPPGGAPAGPQAAAYGALRAQGDARGDRHGDVDGLQFVRLEDHGQGQDGLQHREVLADAGPRPAAEREPGVARPVLLPVGGEPVGVEALGLVPVAGVAVRHPGRDDHVGARGDGVAVDAGGGDGAAANDGARRVQPHGLLEDTGQVRQRVEVAGDRSTAAQHARGLVAGTFLLLGVERQQVQGEGQRGGGRLVPGEQEDQHLVADLAGVQAAVLAAAGQGEQAEQVVRPVRAVGGTAARAAPSDDAVALGVQLGHRGGRAAVGGRGPVPGRGGGGERAPQDVVADDGKQRSTTPTADSTSVPKRMRATARRVSRVISADTSTTPPGASRQAAVTAAVSAVTASA